MDDCAAFKLLFGGTGGYVRNVSGAAVVLPVWMHVEELDSPARPGPGLSQHFGQGVAAFAQAWLDAAELAGLGVSLSPLDVLADPDGREWVIERFWAEGGLLAAHLTSSSLLVDIAIQAKTSGKSSVGSATQTWAAAATVKGYFWALSGDERAALGGRQASSTHRARFKAWPGLTPGNHRLAMGLRTFDITFVDDLCEQGGVMVADCLEIPGRNAG